MWNQLSFDLTRWRGRTLQVYFNVYNNGVGGTAGRFLDDVSLTACTGGATPAPTGTGMPTTGHDSCYGRPTSTPGCVNAWSMVNSPAAWPTGRRGRPAGLPW